ncbi:MAG: ChrR family anti-sigma-E factor [Tagaea sp.]|nr:ChrR family anti-sigma-E factor [Tagaea sp.]
MISSTPRPIADEWLLDFAAGSAPEAVSVLVAAHLELCPAARATLARLDAVGGALLEDLPPAGLSPASIEAVFAKLDGLVQEVPPSPPLAPAGLPRALAPYVPDGLDGLTWKNAGRGFEEAQLGRRGRHAMSLLRARDGGRVPTHTHTGTEFLLVLDGAFHDERAHYARGEVCIGDADTMHTPMVARGTHCLCLVVDDGAVRLPGWTGRLLNPLLRWKAAR